VVPGAPPRAPAAALIERCAASGGAGRGGLLGDRAAQRLVEADRVHVEELAPDGSSTTGGTASPSTAPAG
jgi:hypothetical protein